MATPIDYLRLQSASSIIEIPVYNPVDVPGSSFRVMTPKGLACFNLIQPTTSTPFRIMTPTGVLGIDSSIIATGPTVTVEDFTDDAYNFTYINSADYLSFQRFDDTAPNGDVGYLKNTSQGINNAKTEIFFDFPVPVGKIGTVEVDYAVDSEADYDYLRFYLNGVKHAEFSGLNIQGTISIPLSVGDNTLKISYEKDGGENTGADSAWISEIRLTIE